MSIFFGYFAKAYKQLTNLIIRSKYLKETSTLLFGKLLFKAKKLVLTL